MHKALLIFCLFTSFQAFSSELKQEITDLINSNIDFYKNIEPGMGFTGEMISDAVDENGNYLNCTIALRGKNILLNNTLDSEFTFSYQEHWIDINIREGNNCNPDMYPLEHRKFVTMEKKRDPLEIFKVLESHDLAIEKIEPRIYVLNYSYLDEESQEEVNISARYDLNYPLYMNPNANGFKHQRFEYKSIPLHSISLCQPLENGGECSNEQDLRYLFNP